MAQADRLMPWFSEAARAEIYYTALRDAVVAHFDGGRRTGAAIGERTPSRLTFTARFRPPGLVAANLDGRVAA